MTETNDRHHHAATTVRLMPLQGAWVEHWTKTYRTPRSVVIRAAINLLIQMCDQKPDSEAVTLIVDLAESDDPAQSQLGRDLLDALRHVRRSHTERPKGRQSAGLKGAH